jgi:hypothetical protein
LVGRKGAVALGIVAATVTAGCIGFPNPSPGDQAYFVQFEGGGGYRNILTYLNTTGPFPVHAAIDAELRVLYAGLSDGAIHWWNFNDETNITEGVWTPTDLTCVWGGIAVLRNHTLVTACGFHLSLFDPAGASLESINFPGEISGFAVADDAAMVAVAAGPPYAVAIIDLINATVTKRFSTMDNVTQVALSEDGTLLGFSTHSSTSIQDTRTGANLSFGYDGAIAVSGIGNRVWVMEKVGSGPHDALRAYDWPTNGSPRTTIELENSSALSMTAAQFEVFIRPGGHEIAYFSVVGAYSYSGGQFHPSSDVRNLVFSYNESGGAASGLSIPGEEIFVKLMYNGSIYAVSGLRAVLGGSQLWLSYGAPDCAPPKLVRHNVTG